MNKPRNNTINYIELKANDLEAIKIFYNRVFNWSFIDYEEDYISFSEVESSLNRGFEKTN